MDLAAGTRPIARHQKLNGDPRWRTEFLLLLVRDKALALEVLANRWRIFLGTNISTSTVFR